MNNTLIHNALDPNFYGVTPLGKTTALDWESPDFDAPIDFANKFWTPCNGWITISGALNAQNNYIYLYIGVNGRIVYQNQSWGGNVDYTHVSSGMIRVGKDNFVVFNTYNFKLNFATFYPCIGETQ